MIFNFVATKLLILQLTCVQDLDNMGKMGNVLEVFTRVGSALKTSGQITAAGVTSVTIINHPTEGLLFAGEEKLCRKLKELVAKEDIDKELMEESMRSGNNLNHSCTRGEKEELMSKVYDCLLPPLPMPFSEFCNSPTTMLSSHFSRVLEVEMAGLRYKGGPLPEKILEWFKWDQSIFNAIRGATYHKTLPGL